MNFSTALELCKEGYNVSRWDHHYLKMENDSLIKVFGAVDACGADGLNKAEWIPNQMDILSDDWDIQPIESE